MAEIDQEQRRGQQDRRVSRRAPDGKWIAVPASVGSQIKGPCSRIDLMKQHAGIDVQAMYPAGCPPKADAWTLDAMLKAAEACHKAGDPFGIGLGTDRGQRRHRGRDLPVVRRRAGRRQGQHHGQDRHGPAGARILREARASSCRRTRRPGTMRRTTSGWSRAGAALIMNPPSAWAVAKRDAPQVAEQCWTHGMPAGPKGRFAPFLPYFWGIWNFGKNKPAAKSCCWHLSQPAAVEKLVAASGGYDLPSFEKLTTLKTWAEEGPPKGTLYHYPNPHNHQILSIAASAGAAQDRRADLHAGDPDQDDRAPHAGRGDGEDPRLGRERGRRLHADARAPASASRARCRSAGDRRAQRADPSEREADGRCGNAGAVERRCRARRTRPAQADAAPSRPSHS